ncbi:autoinducer binding domain-containing protein [Burkholderia vietnamiensis]|nr:autoinducer binding domain-containing protein [Burkholderia vietnamiensis]MBR7917456.1 autoinducer binding domain-containing protein [Burkholderia vietnamiensis]HDR9756538.1 autoinducer binding domain-containing protein [Burkholderia cepacia ATCC 25416]HDR9789532.1 autoinducer binding domain-containing protein [Burkholderia cepacia ATCC 25416]
MTVICSCVATLHDESAQIGTERVSLRLYQTSEGLSIIDRQSLRGDGVSFTQVVGIEHAADLYDFATADPYAQRLERIYSLMHQKYVEAQPQQGRSSAVKTPGAPLEAIYGIAQCRTEGELLALARTVITAVGGGDFIFQWSRFSADKTGTFDFLDSRYLVGCRPSWLQQYLAKLWYMNDPVVQYARYNVEPTVTSRIHLHRTDHWFITQGHDHGLYHGVVAPVHTPGNGVVGILYVSAPTPKPEAVIQLWENKVLLRALAAELLDWRVAQSRLKATEQVDLSDSETLALQTLHSGGGASHVADRLGLSVHTVYKTIFQRINHKLGVHRIGDAVAKAERLGLVTY